MPAKKEKLISLLPQEEFASTTAGRILNWALTSFRIIVIITEVLVVAAFLSRFWLDAKLTDLNDLARQKQAIILASNSIETEFRDLQKRLGFFSEFVSKTTPVSSLISTVSSYLPPSIILTNFSFSQDSIQIKGATLQEGSIAQFVTNLESSKIFSEISIASIDTDPDDASLLLFNLKLGLKEKGEKT